MALAEEARDALWALCDMRAEASEAERWRAAPDACVADCVASVGQGMVGLVQAEVDRCERACDHKPGACAAAARPGS
jgi:hypothetical protein